MKNSVLIIAAGTVVASVGALAWTAQVSATSEPASCCTSGADSAISTKPALTLEGANRVLAAAIAEAGKRNAGGAIAVVDDGGNLIALQRLDGTFAAGSEVSIGKARTAALFQKATRLFEESINKGRTALVGVSALTPLQGGIPIEYNGTVIGAIGVSGAHSQGEDEEIAIAGASAVSNAVAKQ